MEKYNLKCDVCGKEFVNAADSTGYDRCPECTELMSNDLEEVGDE